MRIRLVLLATLIISTAACGDSNSSPPADSRRDGGPSDGARDSTVDVTSTPDAPGDGASGDTTVDIGPIPDRGKRDLAVFGDLLAKPDGCLPPTGDTCATPKSLTFTGTQLVVSGSTACAKDHLDFPLGGCGGELVDGTPGDDVFFDVTLQPATYELRLTAAWDPALYVIASCSTSTSACIAASDDVNPGTTEKITLKVTSAQSYRIGVDSWDPTESGAFTLTITKQSAPGDGGPTPDTSFDAGPPTDGGTTGPLVITEIMANPAAVADDAGEWFEIHNPGAQPVNLRNWTVQDQPGAAQNKFKIGSDVIVPAGGYVVLGLNGNKATNGGVDIGYVYPAAFQLANGGDEIILLDPSNVEIDRVVFSGTFVASGASSALKSPTLDNNVLTNWCTEATAWTGSAGDKGSPGKPTVCQ